MIRKAFLMSVNPGAELEYERRHNPIPEALEETLKVHGVTNYSIFLDARTRQLFAYAEIADEARWAAIGQTLSCQAWWARMAPLMPHHTDGSPLTTDLREVFHLT